MFAVIAPVFGLILISIALLWFAVPVTIVKRSTPYAASAAAPGTEVSVPDQ